MPAAFISVLDITVAKAGIGSVGYFAQIPHYVSGEYPQASIDLLRRWGGTSSWSSTSGACPRRPA